MIGNGHTQPATAEENQQAQLIMENIEELVLDQEVQQALVQKMSQGEPPDAIGSIAGQLVHMQVVVAEGAGRTISRDILIAVAAEVINLLIEVAMQAGIVQEMDEQGLEKLQGDALISAVDAYMQLGDDDVNGQAAMQVTEKAMGGEIDSPEAQQGLLNNMASPTGPPPEGPPPEGPPPEGMPQQGGMIGGMV